MTRPDFAAMATAVFTNLETPRPSVASLGRIAAALESAYEQGKRAGREAADVWRAVPKEWRAHVLKCLEPLKLKDCPEGRNEAYSAARNLLLELGEK